MNYYEHHIRDYDTATSHLSWDEDMAYSRLLRWYYRKEKPIPADLAEACRQVRAATKVQKDAVAAVLQEFFDLRADGWHQDTCDGAIAAFKAGEPEREAKRKNEDTRLARHRAERAELFGIINAAGLHRPWNARIEELRELVKSLQSDKPATAPATTSNAPATQAATATATPATATQTPDTRHHSPIPNLLRQGDNTRSAPEPARGTSAGALCKAVKDAGMGQVNPSDPRLTALLAKGVTVEHFVSLVPSALDKRNPWAYLLGAVEGQITEAAAIASGPSAAPPAPHKPTRAETQAAVIGALSNPTQRTDHADRKQGAIDVESRIVD